MLPLDRGGRPTDNFIKCVGKLDIKGKDEIKRVYSTKGISPTLNTMQGGNRQPKIMIGASRGRNPENPRDRTTGIPTVQRLEINKNGISNTLTTVQKDNYCISQKGVNFRIRKLTPKECWRLMGFSDEDFEKAEKVNSNTQLYKQAGNSICIQVLMAIFKQLF